MQDQPHDPNQELERFRANNAESGSEFYSRGAARQSAQHGTSAKLEALNNGYFGLNWVFLGNAIAAVSLNFAVGALIIDSPLIYLALLVALLFGIGFATYPFNKQIAYGKGWKPGSAILASVLMALSSTLCCGIIGYIVMQQFASAEMKKYGIKIGIFGAKKRDIKARIQELRRAGQ